MHWTPISHFDIHFSLICRPVDAVLNRPWHDPFLSVVAFFVVHHLLRSLGLRQLAVTCPVTQVSIRQLLTGTGHPIS